MTQKIGLVADDLWLEPYESHINERYDRFLTKLKEIESHSGSLLDFANAHHFFGFHYDKKEKGWYYREWAPEALRLSLVGDFNNWDQTKNGLKRLDNGVWEVFVPDPDKSLIPSGSKVKVHVTGLNSDMDRIPLYANRAVQDPKTHDFAGQIWYSEKKFKWTDSAFKKKKKSNPLIYEAHVGMAQEKEEVGSFIEFKEKVLPRIAALGYNTIQLMAVQEHPYYGSFGYHVSNFFAVSSRFGTPEELKDLINTAHGMGISVVMDIVHSHAVKNLSEGINEFDGTDYQFFHEGPKGDHPLWDSKVFNYNRDEVIQFLLSNIKFWLEEYHFDGFRFDGITSMLYDHHGHGLDFDHYDKYFVEGVDKDAVLYLQLACHLSKQIDPNSILIAEDMSGMPGICRKIEDGGIGFDYRLAMGVPDFWIKYLKEKSDEDWSIGEMYHTLLNRREKENVIAYAESHDQALVGDKSIAFWLMDSEMYYKMQKTDESLIIDRGMALHKMIRLFTLSLGGQGYLTFIGNEFGHPEWIDFPREGNGWSYKHARRQWSLVDNKLLRYEFLNEFDKQMIHLAKENNLLDNDEIVELNIDEANKVAVFERAGLIFAFNFNPSYSIENYKFYVPQKGEYSIVLNSDSSKTGGFDRIDDNINYSTIEEDGVDKLSLYLTARTCLVLKKKD